jgi:hypothetical protein
MVCFVGRGATRQSQSDQQDNSSQLHAAAFSNLSASDHLRERRGAAVEPLTKSAQFRQILENRRARVASDRPCGHYYGDERAPKRLVELEDAFDHIVGATRFIGTEEERQEQFGH